MDWNLVHCLIIKNWRSSPLTSHFWPTVLVLSIKNGFYKIKKSIFRPNYARYEKMLTSKVIHHKENYNFDFDHFLIKRTVFVLILKNVIKNQKFNFPDKLCDIRKNVKKQNCSFQKDLQILFWPFFDKTHDFCFNRDKYY